MSKFTKGKWEAIEVGQGGPADNPVPVYEVHADGYVRVCEYASEANARLIAAAPELLASLIELKQLLDIACSIGAVPSPAANGPAARALAAIRKATGG